MRHKQKGFSLIEILVALAISGVLMLGIMRLFPALQRNILFEYQSINAHESLWQLVFRVGKHLQRAGYCRGVCTDPALLIEQHGSRVLMQWQAVDGQNSTGDKYEQTGYRLHQGTLQILKGTKAFSGELWEKISDPELMTLTHFSVTRKQRTVGPPLLIIHLIAKQKKTSSFISVRHVVRGENL